MAGEADLTLLPRVARELVEALGWEHGLEVVRVYGGTWLYVPDAPTPRILERLSPECAEALCKRFSGNNLDVPRCHRVLIRLRNRAIVQALENRSKVSVALEHKLTCRQIRNIQLAQQAHAQTPQDDLFGDLFQP